MAEDEPSRTCRQCHKEVAEANYALHEMHCSRFLCLCPDCDESVPTDQLSQHREEQHTQLRCSKCNQKMERCQLQDHESDECVERLQSCEYCELELPWKELDQHRLACGSRTERCKDCSRYVKLRDLRVHAATCMSPDDDFNPPQTNAASEEDKQQQFDPRKAFESLEDLEVQELDCLASTTLNDDEEEEEEDDEDQGDSFWEERGAACAPPGAYGGSARPFNAAHVPRDDPDKIRSCPHCHLTLPLPTLRWHQAKCRLNVLLELRDRSQNGQAAFEGSPV